MQISEISDLHPKRFSQYAHLAAENDFAGCQCMVHQEDKNLIGEATVFIPFKGIHFSICGPMDVRTCLRFPVDLDVPMTVFMLTLSGSVCYEEIRNGNIVSTYECCKNNFFAAQFTNIHCETVLQTGPFHCHIEFFLEEDALEKNFGMEASQKIRDAFNANTSKLSSFPYAIIQGIACPESLTLAKKIVASRNDKDIGSLSLRGACLELLSLLAKNICRRQSKATLPLSSQETEKLKRLKKDLESHFLEKDTVKDFCARAGINPSRANQGFMYLFNTSIGRYRLNCRLEYAHNLLASGTVNVSECAWDVGYNNISHFVAVFKKRFGITPGSVLAGSKVFQASK
jgi:AraC-like DNA-binding protein